MDTVPSVPTQSMMRPVAAPPIASTPSLIGASPVSRADADGEIIAVDHHQIGAELLELVGKIGRRTTLTVRPTLMGEHDQQPSRPPSWRRSG